MPVVTQKYLLSISGGTAIFYLFYYWNVFYDVDKKEPKSIIITLLVQGMPFSVKVMANKVF